MKHLDRLMNVNVREVKAVVMRSVFRSTKETAVNMVAATAMLLILLCERHNIGVVEVLGAADRMLRKAADTMPVEVRALRRYVREELPDA